MSFFEKNWLSFGGDRFGTKWPFLVPKKIKTDMYILWARQDFSTRFGGSTGTFLIEFSIKITWYLKMMPHFAGQIFEKKANLPKMTSRFALKISWYLKMMPHFAVANLWKKKKNSILLPQNDVSFVPWNQPEIIFWSLLKPFEAFFEAS